MIAVMMCVQRFHAKTLYMRAGATDGSAIVKGSGGATPYEEGRHGAEVVENACVRLK